MKTGKKPRICIVGAGASGIVAGDTLRKLGYENVTILEKNPERVGGHCYAVTDEGFSMDLGAVTVFPHYPLINQYIKETGCHLKETTPLYFKNMDGSTRPFRTPPEPLSFLAQKREDLRLGYQLFFKYRQALSVPLGKVKPSIMQDLSIPVAEWMEQSGLKCYHGGDFPLMRSFGFGFECQNVPAIYSFQIMMLMAHGGNLLTLLDRSRFSLERVEEGYGELFRRIAKPLNVELGVQIESVKRDGETVVVKSNQGEQEFDYLILACDLKDSLEFLDVTQDEQELFAGVSHIPVWQARFRVSGIDKSLIVENRQNFEKLGYGMAFLKFDPDHDWIYYFGYTSDEVDEQDLVREMKADIVEFGGEVQSEPVMQWWPRYYPHYNSQQVKAGYHARLEDLQGQRNTFLTGAALANNGVEWVAVHAKKLVEQHFA